MKCESREYFSPRLYFFTINFYPINPERGTTHFIFSPSPSDFATPRRWKGWVRVRAARVTLFPSATFVFYLAAPTVSNPQSTCNQRDVLILQPLPVALPRVLLFSTSVLYSSLIKNEKSHTQHTTTAAVKLPPPPNSKTKSCRGTHGCRFSFL